MTNSTHEGALLPSRFKVFTDFEDGKPRIRDVELGEALAYGRPRDIRAIIAPLYRRGSLPGAVAIRVHGMGRAGAPRVSKSRKKSPPGRSGVEYWLDRRAAIAVIMRSDAPKAVELTNEVIDVFMAYLDGRLQPAQEHPLFLRQRREWQALWDPDTVSALCALYGNTRLYTPGGPMPGGWFASIEVRIYEHLWGSEHLAEARERIPRPQRGTNWHQFLSVDARDAVKSELITIAQVALSYSGRRDGIDSFWGWMAGRYLGRSAPVRSLAEVSERQLELALVCWEPGIVDDGRGLS